MFVLGIDAGGTKSVCQLADAQGEVICEAHGAGATLHVMRDADLAGTLADLIARAVGSRPGAPAAMCLGMSGADRPGDADKVRAILTGIDRNSPLVIVNDALIALEAGAPGIPGVVIVAGTGSMVYGRNAAGVAARAGGWGYVLGDEGSGYWMGRQALQAVVRAADARGPATALTALVLQHWRVSRSQDLVREIYGSDPKPTTIAALASVVETAAASGDDIARSIVNRGAVELAAAAVSVSGRLGLDDQPVVLAGSLFKVVPSLSSAVIDRLHHDLPRGLVRLLDVEPVQGAVRLALALAAGGLRLPRYEGT